MIGEVGRTRPPSPIQQKALRLALEGLKLRRLPGGFWINARRRHSADEISETARVSTRTVASCVARGWLSFRNPVGHFGSEAVVPDEGRPQEAWLTKAGCDALGISPPWNENPIPPIY